MSRISGVSRQYQRALESSQGKCEKFPGGRWECDPEANRIKVAGVTGRIANRERLFARSLGQVVLKRHKATPLIRPVIVVERLLTPVRDELDGLSQRAEIRIQAAELDRSSGYAWKDREQTNIDRQVLIYLRSVLSRNHFAEAIGYPDPLHKAACGAKSLGRRASEIIRSSTHYLPTPPLRRTFRAIRDAGDDGEPT